MVVFPAPFGPRKAKISPAATSKETPSTAVTAANLREVMFSARIITSTQGVSAAHLPQ